MQHKLVEKETIDSEIKALGKEEPDIINWYFAIRLNLWCTDELISADNPIVL